MPKKTFLSKHVSEAIERSNAKIEVLISLQREWRIPVMCHEFPKKLLYMMQKKYGKNVIRTGLYYYPY